MTTRDNRSVETLSVETLSVVVPTLGWSPWLAECLSALRRDASPEAQVVVVDGSESGVEVPDGLGVEVLRVAPGTTFAAAHAAALGRLRGELVATVNDDAVVEPGWASSLVAVLRTDAGVGAVQGVNGGPDGRVDGAGVTWNRWWQAVQVGRGEAPPPAEGEPIEVWGVSATAAVYRRVALAAAWDGGAAWFDERLGAYYEDVDLAGRLRAAGWRALVVPEARALHHGSTSGRRLPARGLPLVYGNRLLVLAGLLGRGFWPRLPVLLLRDVVDAIREPRRAPGVVAGWARALRRLPRHARFGRPRVSLSTLRG